MTPKELAGVEKAIAALDERMTALEKFVRSVDEVTTSELFGPDNGEPVTGRTIFERVEGVERNVSATIETLTTVVRRLRDEQQEARQ